VVGSVDAGSSGGGALASGSGVAVGVSAGAVGKSAWSMANSKELGAITEEAPACKPTVTSESA
jgi:hypothetical protein